MPWMMGFQTTDEDVALAAKKVGLDIGLDEAAQLLERLDTKAVARAALKYARDLEGQANAAQEDIVRQLGELGLLSSPPRM